jgi:hypothetical protein
MPEITEIDAPPRASFDIPTGDGFDAPPIRLVFKTLRLKSLDKAKLKSEADLRLNLVRSELQDRWGGIIWWRTRPEFSTRGRMHDWYCRMDTSPQLPDFFWNQIVTPEGNATLEI